MKVNLVLFIVYLTTFVVVLSCFVRMEDFLLIKVYLLYIQGRTSLETELSWRAIELGLQVSVMDKQSM